MYSIPRVEPLVTSIDAYEYTTEIPGHPFLNTVGSLATLSGVLYDFNCLTMLRLNYNSMTFADTWPVFIILHLSKLTIRDIWLTLVTSDDLADWKLHVRSISNVHLALFDVKKGSADVSL